MAVKDKDIHSQRYRKIVIGGNVILTVVIFWLIVIFVNFIAVKSKFPAIDMTRSGQFRLSERTKKLLKTVNQPIHITALYRVKRIEDPKEQERAKEQRRRVEDLLRRYAMVSGKITYEVIDPLTDTKAKEKLIRRLIKKYSSEAEKHQKVIEKFTKTSSSILKLLIGERDFIQKLAEKNQNLNKDRGIIEIYIRFTRDIQNIKLTVNDVDELINGGDIPRYTDAVEQIKKVYENTKTDLELAGKYLSEHGCKIEGLSGREKDHFKSAQDRYARYIKDIKDELEKTTDLPKLQLEEIYDAVKPKDAKVIVVEVKDKAKVLDFDKVWVISNRQTGTGEVAYDFNGEAAISSAILSLTAKEKSAVVFIHAGQPDPIKPGFAMMRMTQPPYKAAKEKLEEANMVVKSWDILQSDTPPTFEENIKNIVYIIVPSTPKQRQPGMVAGGYNEKAIEKIEKLIDEGNRVMFLVKFTPMLFARPYPFADMLKKKFGIDVEVSKLVIKGLRIKNQIIPDNRILITKYDGHEITSPLQGLPSMFQWAVPILIEKKLPDGVKVEPLITITNDLGEYWAESNVFTLLQKAYAKPDKDADTFPPFHLAVAVENTKIGTKTVIFGNDTFATDAIANQQQYVLTAKGIGAIILYPGNLELFANSVFWLNDNKNLIAVGPRRADVPRIVGLSDSAIMFWKIFFWVIWPLTILAIGGIVYTIRQK